MSNFDNLDDAEDYIHRLEGRIDKLQAFKDYVHARLDEFGVDKHEEQNATTGCRIGARLDDVLNETIALRSIVDDYHQSEAQLHG